MTAEEINVAAFLKFIRFAETKREDDMVFLAVRRCADVFGRSKHPNKPILAWGKRSTAAGAYQILYPSWEEAKEMGIVSDFSKTSQDKFAIWKLRRRQALEYFDKYVAEQSKQ